MAGRQIVSALPEEETLLFFERIRLREVYESGDLLCSICGEALRSAGLGAVRADADGQFVFACTKLDCLEDVANR